MIEYYISVYVWRQCPSANVVPWMVLIWRVGLDWPILQSSCQLSSTVQWGRMSAKASQIMYNSTVCSAACPDKQKKKTQSAAFFDQCEKIGGFPWQRATKLVLPYHYVIYIHPSTKVMADFFQTRKSTWCPHPICTIFDECIDCMYVSSFHTKYIDLLN